MAVSIQHRSGAEPSSDFPTEDDCEPCSMMRGRALACALASALVVGVIGFLIGRARGRRVRS